MFLHAGLLTRMLYIIILIVIPSIPKAVCCFTNILFSTILTEQKSNQAVIATGEYVIYFICITGKCVRFRDIHTYFTPFLKTFC